MSTFEPDTGLLVNTGTGTVHKPDCPTLVPGSPWTSAWKGVAISGTDKACRSCKPDLEDARRLVNYEIGYRDGESSMQADYALALDEVWPDERGEPWPTVVAAYIKELQSPTAAAEPDTHLVGSDTHLVIEWRPDPATAWVPWARGTGEEAVRVAISEFREAKPRAEWRVVRVTTTTVVEDW